MLNWFSANNNKKLSSLRSDNDGAIMVIGVFMAAFLVGMLYYLLGLGQTMLFRQRMQDAADATTFSAAVMNARGMNLMVLINMIMALLLAILIIIRGLQILLGVALVIVTILCAIPWTAAAGCPLVSPVQQGLQQMTNLYNNLKDPIFNACKALTQVNRQIRNFWWLVAQADAVTTAMNGYNPPVMVGFVWPVYQQMPTKDGQFSDLCQRAAMIPGQIIGNFLGNLVGDAVGNFIADMLSGFFRLAAYTVCPGGSPPSGNLITGSLGGEDLNDAFNSAVKPDGPDGEACRGGASGTPAPDQAACNRHSTWMQQSSPGADGTCNTATSRTECENRRSQAANQCNPSSGGHPRDQSWTQAITEYHYTTDSTGALQQPATPPTPTYSQGSGELPCGTGSDENRYSDYSSGDPICTQDRQAMLDAWLRSIENPDSPGTYRANQSTTIRVRAVQWVYSCKVDNPREINAPRDNSLNNAGACGDPDIAHQVMKDCGQHLGEQVFQLLGVSVANDDAVTRFRTGNDRGLFVAAFGRQLTASGFFGGMQELARFSLAQGEFYWKAPTNDEGNFFRRGNGHEEWMWEMGWRGRMRRVNITSFFQSTNCEQAQSCSGGGGSGSGQSNSSVSPANGQASESEAGNNMNQMQILDAVLIH